MDLVESIHIIAARPDSGRNKYRLQDILQIDFKFFAKMNVSTPGSLHINYIKQRSKTHQRSHRIEYIVHRLPAEKVTYTDIPYPICQPGP